MDIIKAEIARKRKLLEEKKLLEGDKKFFKRGDLIAKEQEEYLKKYRPNENVVVLPSSSKTDSLDPTDTETVNDDDGKPQAILPRTEVIRRLRERCEPIFLFGESELDAFRRLRQSEISEPEINRGFRNDFQAAMDQVDQAFLDEILKSHTTTQNNDGDGGDGEGTSGSSGAQGGTSGGGDKEGGDSSEAEEMTMEKIQEMARGLGRGNKDRDTEVILTLLEFLLKLWNGQLNSCSAAERMATKSKIARATYTQTQVYMRPLLRKLKNKTLPEDILDSLTDIVKLLLDRNYIKASDAYLQMAIGNAPWPIGVTMVGIHARTGREKIFSKNVAHVLNDETQRKYIQGLKRLMTRCQEYFPTDPSRCVEYVSKKDLDRE